MTGSNLSLTNYHVNTLTDFYAAKPSLNDSLKIVQSCKQLAFNTRSIAYQLLHSTELVQGKASEYSRRLQSAVGVLSNALYELAALDVFIDNHVKDLETLQKQSESPRHLRQERTSDSKLVKAAENLAVTVEVAVNAFMVGQSTALMSANLEVESCKRRLNRPVDELSSLPVLFEPASPRKAQGLLPQL